MDTIQALAIRTHAALIRLSELELRAERAPSGTAPIVRSALKDLSAALRDLQVAGEQLRMLAEDLAAARAHARAAESCLDEFSNQVPLACIWTNAEGVISEGNRPAAELLNVARHRLAGKPLMLFLADRTRFVSALRDVAAPEHTAVELELVLRPRERRPRQVRLTGRRLQNDPRCCWFIAPASATRDAQSPTVDGARAEENSIAS